MREQRNFYDILGMPTTATQDELKKKYRELARKHHPDLADDKVRGQMIFAQINQAYHVLGDPERRGQYDAAFRSPAGFTNSAGVRHQPFVIVAEATQVGSATGVHRKERGMDQTLREAENALIAGQSGTARKLCEAILKVDSQNARALGILGHALAHLKETDLAISVFTKSLSIEPSVIIEAKLDMLLAAARAEEKAHQAASKSPKTKAKTRRRGIIARLMNHT